MTSDQGYVTGNFLTSDISSNKISALKSWTNWQTNELTDRQVTYRGIPTNYQTLCAGGHINYFALKYVTCKCNCISFIVAMTTVCTKQNKLIFSLCEDT